MTRRLSYTLYTVYIDPFNYEMILARDLFII